MNKYYVKIPYHYTQYGDLSGFVYAENEEEAAEIAADHCNIHEESYDDSDDSGDSEYDYSETTVTLEESDIPSHEIPARQTSFTYRPESPPVPGYFLEDLPELKKL